jgi:hypothetical protein
MDPFSTSKLTLLSALIPPKEIVRFSILRMEFIFPDFPFTKRTYYKERMSVSFLRKRESRKQPYRFLLPQE